MTDINLGPYDDIPEDDDEPNRLLEAIDHAGKLDWTAPPDGGTADAERAATAARLQRIIAALGELYDADEDATNENIDARIAAFGDGPVAVSAQDWADLVHGLQDEYEQHDDGVAFARAMVIVSVFNWCSRMAANQREAPTT